MTLNPDQFSVHHEEHSPVEDSYPGFAQIRRIVVRHPEVTPTKYALADTTNTEYRRGSSKPIKKVTPGAGPNAAGMMDYETQDGGDGVYVRYMASERPKEGIPRRLMDAVVSKHNPSTINFGKIMTPKVVDVMRSTSKRYPNIYIHGQPDFGRKEEDSQKAPRFKGGEYVD